MDNTKLLVIGGAGYVGSHFICFAQDMGYDVTVLDNLSTGHLESMKESSFIKGDLTSFDCIYDVLSANQFGGIFHFAASCLVGESVSNPALYYRNNVMAGFNMLEAMRLTGHSKVVFSSTCAVYGTPVTLPLREEHPKNPISPYGRSKLAIEWMLEDYSTAYSISFAALRYFNAAGCEPQRGLGEDHEPETHLIPNVVRYALGLNPELVIFGNDYPTPDGTCIRDYIHVMDLADAHIKALNKLENESAIRLNLGTGKGISNLEIIQAVEERLNEKIKYKVGPRRPGDPPELVADASAAAKMLEWTPKRSGISSIVGEVLDWYNMCPNGYGK